MFVSYCVLLAFVHVSDKRCLQTIYVDGKKNVVPEVWEVLDKIKAFSNKVSSLIQSSTTTHMA